MKRNPLSRGSEGGFSLVELMVAMVISMVLLAALASIFTQVVTTREKIDRDGQKIEAARYSLDTLAEDIRLAGYFGSYSPPFVGSTPADWKYVDPCSTTGGNPLPGWNATTSPVQVPFAIFGYEAHGTGNLPAALTNCLNNYRTGTDVFVIRRASTVSVTAGGGGYVAGEAYLQASSCSDGSIDTQPFQAMTTTTASDFNLHVLGCVPATPGTNAVLRKLITRIYYVSNCDDCANDLDGNAATPGDGIPTLKMVELAIPSSGGTALKVIENLRTIAPGVEQMHIEYGLDGAFSTWTMGTVVPSGAVRLSGNNFYTTILGGTTGASAPGHISGSASDGNVLWNYSGVLDGSVTSWVVSNADPHNGVSGTPVVGMGIDALGENRWEDVMAVKLFLVTRDLKPTSGWTDGKSFTLGSVTVAAANDAYRRRATSSTIKLVNMSTRRETP